MIERARSLTLPWSFLMVVGAKRFETRGQASDFRGRWAVHATQSWTFRRPPRHGAEALVVDGRDFCERYPFKEVLSQHGVRDWKDLDWMRGKILGSVEQVGCVPTDDMRDLGKLRSRQSEIVFQHGSLSDASFCGELPATHEWAFGDYSAGRFIYVCRDRVRLQVPIPCSGSLGLWRIPEHLRGGVDA